MCIRDRYYVPYVTLAVMTFPAIVEATQSPVVGAVALVVGILAAWFGASLFQVSVACCAVAVSYTHLDVYKRQVLLCFLGLFSALVYFKNIQKFLFVCSVIVCDFLYGIHMQFFACLLYTSRCV